MRSERADREPSAVRTVHPFIDPPNTASIRVATHLEMSFESDAEFFGKVVRRYVLPAGDAAFARTPSAAK